MTRRSSPTPAARPGAPAPNRSGSAFLAALALLAAATSAGAQEVLPDTLDLDRALRIALARNPEIAQAQAQADAAGWGRRAAWGAFLPTASASANLGRSNFTTNTFLSPEGESQSLPDPLTSQRQSAGQSLGLNWTVLDVGNIAGFREQGARLEASQRRLDDQRLAVIAEVRRTYLEALRRQRLLELSRRQIADRERELDITRRRYEIAAVERSDVLGAETQLLNAEVSLLSETSQFESAIRGLAVAMGLTPESGVGTVLADISMLPDAAGLSAEALVDRALGEDPELLALEADAAAASASLWGSRSRFLPTIQLGYSWSWSEQFGPDASFFQFDLGSNTNRSLSLSAQWTLFDGFQREQQTAAASSQRRQAEEGLRLRRLAIERDVRRFLQEIEQLDQSLALIQRALEISEERLEMTRLQYQRGTATYTALQQAIGDVTQAERSLIEQTYSYLTAWANLEEYVGDPR